MFVTRKIMCFVAAVMVAFSVFGTGSVKIETVYHGNMSLTNGERWFLIVYLRQNSGTSWNNSNYMIPENENTFSGVGTDGILGVWVFPFADTDKYVVENSDGTLVPKNASDWTPGGGDTPSGPVTIGYGVKDIVTWSILNNYVGKDLHCKIGPNPAVRTTYVTNGAENVWLRSQYFSVSNNTFIVDPFDGYWGYDKWVVPITLDLDYEEGGDDADWGTPVDLVDGSRFTVVLPDMCFNGEQSPIDWTNTEGGVFGYGLDLTFVCHFVKGLTIDDIYEGASGYAYPAMVDKIQPNTENYFRSVVMDETPVFPHVKLTSLSKVDNKYSLWIGRKSFNSGAIAIRYETRFANYGTGGQATLYTGNIYGIDVANATIGSQALTERKKRYHYKSFDLNEDDQDNWDDVTGSISFVPGFHPNLTVFWSHNPNSDIGSFGRSRIYKCLTKNLLHYTLNVYGTITDTSDIRERILSVWDKTKMPLSDECDYNADIVALKTLNNDELMGDYALDDNSIPLEKTITVNNGTVTGQQTINVPELTPTLLFTNAVSTIFGQSGNGWDIDPVNVTYSLSAQKPFANDGDSSASVYTSDFAIGYDGFFTTFGTSMVYPVSVTQIPFSNNSLNQASLFHSKTFVTDAQFKPGLMYFVAPDLYDTDTKWLYANIEVKKGTISGNTVYLTSTIFTTYNKTVEPSDYVIVNDVKCLGFELEGDWTDFESGYYYRVIVYFTNGKLYRSNAMVARDPNATGTTFLQLEQGDCNFYQFYIQ